MEEIYNAVRPLTNKLLNTTFTHRFYSTKPLGLFGFTAISLNGMEISPFLVSFAQKVIASDNKLESSLHECLNSGLTLGRHTTVIFMRMQRLNGAETLETIEYAWTSEKIRPNGQVLPAQCKDCNSLFTYGGFKIDEERGVVKATCKGTRYDGLKCNGVFECTTITYNELPIFGVPSQGAWRQRSI
jgi:hypothetical protein